jgi:hypothetical protein
MTKIPEQLAADYVQAWWGSRDDNMTLATRQSFVAGYQAAMNSPEDPDSCEHILDMSKMVNVSSSETLNNSSNNSNGWISVKQQMPDVHEEVLVNIIYPIEKIEKLAYRLEGDKAEWFVLPDPQGYFWNEEWVTHWMPLPKSPEE